ncbi:SRPBCC domain-containing protein [Spirosoma pollinicola]|uniref:SRPBCC domain-containing protein n=1 Tax=Spirosoma pollinicola TaxID=2057025 RepID=A0A2K8YW79_9BACT|nr:SRPBCC domain-containing protein [Spirosoma pollinicola]AUD01900.1 SRPBCC domain-containing protein [Spirosoma pollinicola]
MANTPYLTQDGKANTVKKLFSRETSVSITIDADPSIIWALLTTASDYPRWNSTIVSIEGTISPNEKIKLTSTLDPKRVFTLQIKQVDPEKKLVWGDSMGNRIYALTSSGKGSTRFSMTEKIGGPLFPLFAKMIPPFDQSFNQFAADLKKEAERIMNMK